MVLRVGLIVPELEFDLFRNCKVFDYHKVWLKDGYFTELLNDFATKEEALDASMQLLKGIMVRSLKQVEAKVRGGRAPQLFKYFGQDKVLYTTLQSRASTFKKAANVMLSWDLEGLIINGALNYDYRPVVCINNLQLFYS